MSCWLKHTSSAVILLGLAAGVGTASDSFAGLETLPAPFPMESRVENAVAVRVTESGLRFIEANALAVAMPFLADFAELEGGVLRFPIPTTEVNETGVNLTVCEAGPDEATGRCIAEIDVGKATFNISGKNPNNVVVRAVVPVRLKDLPLKGNVAVVGAIDNPAVLAEGGGGPLQGSGCNQELMTYANIPVEAEVALVTDKNPAHADRHGYSKANIVDITIDEPAVTSAFKLCNASALSAVMILLKNTIIPPLIHSMKGPIVDVVDKALCAPPDSSDPPCPDGATERDGGCYYADNTCRSLLLGMDGHVDLAEEIAPVLPGTKGAFDFLVAVGGLGVRTGSATWGDLNPENNGLTLGAYGGALPAPVASCITPVSLTLPLGIPQPDEIMANTISGWVGEGPHVGVAVSERFVNYAAAVAHNSGLACVDVSTDVTDVLSTGLFSLVIPSIKYLTHQKGTAQLAISVRPKQAPTLAFGNGTNMTSDPLVRASIKEAVVHFYVWSSDRFVRAFTAQVDIDVPLGITIDSAGITPVLDTINISNTVITNNELLAEEPADIADGLASVIEGVAADYLGAIPSFSISDLISEYGVDIILQQSGFKRLTKGSDNFLGVFANGGVLPATTSLMSEPSQTNTTVEVTEKSTPADGFRLSTASAENRPNVVLRAKSSLESGPFPVEYTYKLDNGLWHSWRASGDIVVDDAFLLMQGIHTITVKSRAVDQPMTEDQSPAVVQVRIDVQPPVVEINRNHDDTLKVDAWDVVSDKSTLVGRYRFDDGKVSDWAMLESLQNLAVPSGASSVTVEVRDEEGNIAQQKQAFSAGSSAKLNTAVGEVACSVRDSSGRMSYGAAFLLGLGLAGVGVRRSRSRSRVLSKAVIGTATLALAGFLCGCSCGGDESKPKKTDEKDAEPDNVAVDAEPPVPIVLQKGLIGSYTSADIGSDGTLWVAGYNEADWDNDASYGDLVVGKWNGSAVDWESVDGVPDVPPDDVLYDTESSWRGGLNVPGPDVGLWTSLKLDAAGNPGVTYWDYTNKSLKFARLDGSAWSVSTVFARSGFQAGRYAKQLIVDGKPVVAFQQIEAGSEGYATSRVILARAKNATPSGEGDWTLETVAENNETPCRDGLCSGSQRCFADLRQCRQPASNCNPGCATGTACLEGECLQLFDATKLDSYAVAIGDYISIAADSDSKIGIVYYDGIHGRLIQARESGASWETAILDGSDPDNLPALPVNVGKGTALAIDGAGNWHVAYVDAVGRSLKYMQVGQNGTDPKGAEVVDDGSGTLQGVFSDGYHYVGDDPNISVSASGEVRIAYQDATAGTLRWAVGQASAGGSFAWTLSVLVQDGFAGFFPQQLVSGTSIQIVNWWRMGRGKSAGDVRVVSPE